MSINIKGKTCCYLLLAKMEPNLSVRLFFHRYGIFFNEKYLSVRYHSWVNIDHLMSRCMIGFLVPDDN